MLFDEIKKEAKTEKVKVYFDMDGCLVQYGFGEKELIANNHPDFYYDKRPIKTVIKVAKKLSKIKNVEVLIMSCCRFVEQRQDKKRWLKKFAPFFKDENIHIIVYSEETFEKNEKSFLKARKIEKLSQVENAKIYLIEDDHRNIQATNQTLSFVEARHISELIK